MIQGSSNAARSFTTSNVPDVTVTTFKENRTGNSGSLTENCPRHRMTQAVTHGIMSDKQLFDMTKNGTLAALPPGYKTGMPAYRDKLSDADIWAVLSYIESAWPADIRAKQQRMSR